MKCTRAISKMKIHWLGKTFIRQSSGLPIGSPILGAVLDMCLGHKEVQFDRLIAECACLRGDTFNLKSFFDEYFSLSTIPASLIRWEMTGSREPMFNP